MPTPDPAFSPECAIRAMGLQPGFTMFSYEDIEAIMSNRKLGTGGSADVYEGQLPGGGPKVAIKRMRIKMTEDMLTKAKSTSMEEQFWQELHVLGSYWHPNLVPVIGACLQPGAPLCIVYPFMQGGSLHSRLVGRGGRPPARPLNYVQRLSAATGACFGLAYLHSRTHTPWLDELPEGAEDKKPMIVHRDIKTDNILLDEDLNARLADCGLATDMAGDAHSQSMSLAGSEGYLDPEAVMTGHFGERSDIYAMGVVLLELLTGQAARSVDEVPQNLVARIWPTLLCNPADVADECWPATLAYRVAMLAERCLRSKSGHGPALPPPRPSAAELASELAWLCTEGLAVYDDPAKAVAPNVPHNVLKMQLAAHRQEKIRQRKEDIKQQLDSKKQSGAGVFSSAYTRKDGAPANEEYETTPVARTRRSSIAGYDALLAPASTRAPQLAGITESEWEPIVTVDAARDAKASIENLVAVLASGGLEERPGTAAARQLVSLATSDPRARGSMKALGATELAVKLLDAGGACAEPLRRQACALLAALCTSEESCAFVASRGGAKSLLQAAAAKGADPSTWEAALQGLLAMAEHDDMLSVLADADALELLLTRVRLGGSRPAVERAASLLLRLTRADAGWAEDLAVAGGVAVFTAASRDADGDLLETLLSALAEMVTTGDEATGYAVAAAVNTPAVATKALASPLESVRAAGLAVFAALAAHDAGRKSTLAALPRTVQLLTGLGPNGSKAVRDAAVGVLAGMAESDDFVTRAAVASAGALPALVGALSRGSEDVAAAVVSAFANVAGVPACRAAVLAGLPPLVDALWNAAPFASRGRDAAARVIAALAKSFGAEPAMEAAVYPLAQALAAARGDAAASGPASALKALGHDHASLRVPLARGLVAATTMGGAASASEGVEHLARAMAILAREAGGGEALGAAGALTWLVDALAKGAGGLSEAALAAAAAALAALVGGSTSAAIAAAAAGAQPVLLGLLSSHAARMHAAHAAPGGGEPSAAVEAVVARVVDAAAAIAWTDGEKVLSALEDAAGMLGAGTDESSRTGARLVHALALRQPGAPGAGETRRPVVARAPLAALRLPHLLAGVMGGPPGPAARECARALRALSAHGSPLEVGVATVAAVVGESHAVGGLVSRLATTGAGTGGCGAEEIASVAKAAWVLGEVAQLGGDALDEGGQALPSLYVLLRGDRGDLAAASHHAGDSYPGRGVPTPRADDADALTAVVWAIRWLLASPRNREWLTTAGAAELLAPIAAGQKGPFAKFHAAECLKVLKPAK